MGLEYKRQSKNPRTVMREGFTQRRNNYWHAFERWLVVDRGARGVWPGNRRKLTGPYGGLQSSKTVI